MFTRATDGIRYDADWGLHIAINNVSSSSIRAFPSVIAAIGKGALQPRVSREAVPGIGELTWVDLVRRGRPLYLDVIPCQSEPYVRNIGPLVLEDDSSRLPVETSLSEPSPPCDA